MKHQPVESSAMQSVGYEDGAMEVTFKSGKTSRYSGVSPELHRDFMESPSKGKFFAANIRNQFGAQPKGADPERGDS